MSAVQDLVIAPVWMAIVWLVHALLVMLEWGFSVDLLGGPQARGLGSGLARVREALTAPLLPVALAAASVLAAYHGIVRRRVTYTFGNVGLMLAMMAGGLWVIANPPGTVGALARWTNETSLGALAAGSGGTTPATSQGARARRARAFRDDGRGSVVLPGVWGCCLVQGSRRALTPRRVQLDSGLPPPRSCSHRVADGRRACLPARRCPQPRSSSSHSGANLLREARTNADLFLSLPPNSPARNSISEDPSLLRAICRSSDVSSCQGNAAPQAQFRTTSGTWAPVGGLLLIAGGLSGILLIFGFLAMRLLTAATLSLLLLLLAPVAVLAPAFGERGRNLFRHWVTRLLGAVLAKLMFALLLGALFAVFAAISSLRELGWWTQWLLMSSLAWTVFVRRNQALPVPGGGESRGRVPSSRLGGIDRVRAAVNKPRALLRRARTDLRDAVEPFSDSTSQRGFSSLIAGGSSGSRGDPSRPATHDPHGQNDVRERLLSVGVTAKRAQLERVERAQTTAFVASDDRRQVELAHRASRVQAEIEREDRGAGSGQVLGRERAGRSKPDGRAIDVADTRSARRTSSASLAPLSRVQVAALTSVGGVHSADWPNGPGGRPEAVPNAEGGGVGSRG